MTLSELKAIWARYMHRSDLTADLDTVYALAQQRAQERVLAPLDLDDLLANNPRMLIHAGLCHLHELAQDDEGLAREMALFNEAVTDFSIYMSRQRNATVDPFSYITEIN